MLISKLKDQINTNIRNNLTISLEKAWNSLDDKKRDDYVKIHKAMIVYVFALTRIEFSLFIYLGFYSGDADAQNITRNENIYKIIRNYIYKSQ